VNHLQSRLCTRHQSELTQDLLAVKVLALRES